MNAWTRGRLRSVLLLLLGCLNAAAAGAGGPEVEDGDLLFDDRPMRRDVVHPDWFKVSFLDLREDLAEAVGAGKHGLMVYFGQRHCAYCQALMEHDFGQADIEAYTRAHFDVVPIDIWGDRNVTDLRGRRLSEKALAERERTNFTPSILFYDARGVEVLRLRGYYPPYTFRAALEYVADAHYREGSLRDYLARAEVGLTFGPEDLVEEDFFSPPPYLLARTPFPGERPLLVFFEHGNCHACDVLHTEQLSDPRIRDQLERFETVQLDMSAETPVVRPNGTRTTARRWASSLGIFYAPTLVFFDEVGLEIFRIDSVVHFHRLSGVLDFILSKDYRFQPYYQRWREEQVGARRTSGGLPQD